MYPVLQKLNWVTLSGLSVIKPGIVSTHLTVSRLPPCDRGRQIPFTLDDSGVLICFLPLPKPSTCLPVLCRGSVSVHTAVSSLRLHQSSLEIDTTANNIRKANHSFPCPAHLNLGDFMNSGKMYFPLNFQKHWRDSCKLLRSV